MVEITDGGFEEKLIHTIRRLLDVAPVSDNFELVGHFVAPD